MAKGRIKFESATSEFLECSCGNNVMRDGFVDIAEDGCDNLHYVCTSCQRNACVSFRFRTIDNTWDLIGHELEIAESVR